MNSNKMLTVDEFREVVSDMSIHDIEKWAYALFKDSHTIIKRKYWWNPLAIMISNKFQKILVYLADGKLIKNHLSFYKKIEKLDRSMDAWLNDSLSNSLYTYTQYYLGLYDSYYLDEEAPLHELLHKLIIELSELPFWIVDSGLTKMSKQEFLNFAYNTACELKKKH